MLADAKLPPRFWAESVSTAVYLRNRSPTTAVKGKTPLEAWTGKKPNVKHLRVFGCEAYAHVPKDERQKLDSSNGMEAFKEQKNDQDVNVELYCIKPRYQRKKLKLKMSHPNQ